MQRSGPIDLFSEWGLQIKEGWAVDQWILDDLWSRIEIEQWGAAQSHRG